ncbi:MAG: MepB family protein [Bacteroidia bacterium]
MKTSNAIPSDLVLVITSFSKYGLDVSQLKAEDESADYGAYTFILDGKRIVFRVAKITPTKTGQFVTLWKRKHKDAPIEPFEVEDDIDFFIISARNGNYFGQFIFPRSVLHSKGILSDKNKEGKRAIRVYPPWDKTANKQATKTQQWQLNYFLDNTADINLAKVKNLLFV